jgi:hypothetical protein
LAAHDARERLASIEDKARQIAMIEPQDLEIDQLEDRVLGLEASLKPTEERLGAAEMWAREAEAAAESARQGAERSESAWHQDNLMLQQSIEKTTRLEAEIKKLQARDIERQDEILGV